jgi:uncharacterized tellurite resistance protein B-like protein
MTKRDMLIKSKEIAEAQKIIIKNQYEIQDARLDERIEQLNAAIEKTTD